MTNQNKLGRINKWLALVANFGVLLGLIILIVEVRQNANLTRATLEVQSSSGFQALESQLMAKYPSEVWAKSISDPSSLNAAEIRVLDAHLVSVLQQWHQLKKMEEDGLIPLSRVERSIRNGAIFYFGNPFAKNWWSNEKPGWRDTGLIEIVDPIIIAIDPTTTAKRIEALRIAPRNNAE